MTTAPQTSRQRGWPARRLEYRRGFAGVAVHDHTHDVNVDGIVRSAACFGLDFVAVSAPYSPGPAAVGHESHLPIHRVDDVRAVVPRNAEFVAIEATPDATALPEFRHPERAVYVAGTEATGLPDGFLADADHVVEIPAQWCCNVETAASIVLADRARELATVTDGGGPDG